MRVMVAGDKSIADMAALMAKAFRLRGHDVDLFYFNEAIAGLEAAPVGGRLIKEAGRRVLMGLFGLSWKEHYFRLINQRFLHRALTYRPDFLLVIGGVQLFPETISYLKRAASPRLANWVVDDPARAHAGRFVETYPLCDVLFSCGPDWLDFARLWSCRVEYLPLATDPDVYAPDGKPGERPPDASDDADAVFVGTFVPGDPSSMFRASILARLANRGLRVRIYGRGIAHYVQRFPELQTFESYEGHLPAATISRIYQHSKIVLNIHNIFNQRVIALRVFEVASAGGFQLTAYQPGLDQLFPEGMIETYRDTSELLDKLDYYLHHPQERRQMAQAAAAFTREHHSYARRVDQILEHVFSGAA